MKNNELFKRGENLVRVLDFKDGQVFIVDCRKRTMPKWVSADFLSGYIPCPAGELDSLPDINELDL